MRREFPSPLSRGGVRGGAAPLRHAKSPPPAPSRKTRGGENPAMGGGNPRYFAAFSALTSSVTAASEDLISPWKNFVTTSW